MSTAEDRDLWERDEEANRAAEAHAPAPESPHSPEKAEKVPTDAGDAERARVAKYAEAIWTTSRRDEGTISATGANIVARAVIAIADEETARLRRGARTLGETIDKQCRMVLDATDLHDWVDETGDGDWGAIWDHLFALRDRAEAAEAEVERLREERDWHHARADVLLAKESGRVALRGGKPGDYWAEWHRTHCAAVDLVGVADAALIRMCDRAESAEVALVEARAQVEAVRAPVLAEVAAERQRQDEKWGQQNHPNGTGEVWAFCSGQHSGWAQENADDARRRCQEAPDRSWGDTYALILNEEVAEAFAEDDPARLRAELVQVAAVAVAWIEKIDRDATLSSAAADTPEPASPDTANEGGE